MKKQGALIRWLDGRGRVEAWLDNWVHSTGIKLDPVPTDDERTIALDYARGRIHQFLRVAGLLGIAAMLFWWLLDFLVLAASTDPRMVEAYTRLRIGIICLAVLFVAFHRPLSKIPVFADATCIVALLTTVGWALSPVGIDAPPYHTTYWLLAFTVIELVGLRFRVIICASASLGLWAGMFLSRPDLLDHELHALAISTIVGVSTITCIASHFLFVLLLNLFVARARLISHTDTLEDEVAHATAQLRALTIKADALRENEWRAMAHEIHDELGQQLTGLRLAVVAGEMTVEDDPTEAAPILADIESKLELTATTMRRLLHRLRPVALDELGLKGALSWLVSEVSGQEALELKLDVEPGCDSLSSDVALAVYRVTQEALTNVLKHAEATSLEITLHKTNEAWTLLIDDNGVGLNLPEGRTGALGLAGMRMRAEACGGHLSLEASPLGGTRVCLVLPLDA